MHCTSTVRQHLLLQQHVRNEIVIVNFGEPIEKLAKRFIMYDPQVAHVDATDLFKRFQYLKGNGRSLVMFLCYELGAQSAKPC